jgi:hypothetical protein
MVRRFVGRRGAGAASNRGIGSWPIRLMRSAPIEFFLARRDAGGRDSHSAVDEEMPGPSRLDEADRAGGDDLLGEGSGPNAPRGW